MAQCRFSEDWFFSFSKCPVLLPGHAAGECRQYSLDASQSSSRQRSSLSPSNNGSYSECTERVQLRPDLWDCCVVLGELGPLCHLYPTVWSEGITEDTGWTRTLWNKILEKCLLYWSQCSLFHSCRLFRSLQLLSFLCVLGWEFQLR